MISIFFEAFLPSETEFKIKKPKEKFSGNATKTRDFVWLLMLTSALFRPVLNMIKFVYVYTAFIM
ncbi:MAG: hypothetical protein PWP45_453 [Tepidanaerobacteraceae bacterium]|nr:hypothetical protein [Tepidanaerobacteraceae bacterium]